MSPTPTTLQLEDRFLFTLAIAAVNADAIPGLSVEPHDCRFY
jgi:hypothetical protein